MKKLLFVIERLERGGAERVTSYIASEFAKKKGMEVHLCKFYHGKAEYGISSKVKQHVMAKNSEYKYFEIIYEYLFLKKVIADIKPDAVISLATFRTNIMLGFGSIKRDFTLILSERNDPRRFPSKKTAQWLRNISYQICDGIVFQTEDARRLFPSSISKKSVVIENPVSVPEMEICGQRKKRIVNCSRLETQKNIPLLLYGFQKIAGEFKEYSLHIYGDGYLLDELKQLSGKLGIEDRVFFHGLVKDVLYEIYNAALFVSTSNYEGISNAMLEAMALGIPAICTDCPVGGARMVIKNGENGLLVPVNDVDKLAESMRLILGDKDFAAKIGNNAGNIKEQYSVKQISGKWAFYIEKVIETRRRHKYGRA